MHFYKEGSRNPFYNVYLAFIAESGCDEGVNILDIDATRFPLPDPSSFHACAYTYDGSTKRLASLQHPAHPLFRRNMHQHHNTPVKQHAKRWEVLMILRKDWAKIEIDHRPANPSNIFKLSLSLIFPLTCSLCDLSSNSSSC